MPRKRPVIVVVMAITNMVLGGLGLLCGCLAFVGFLQIQKASQAPLPPPPPVRFQGPPRASAPPSRPVRPQLQQEEIMAKVAQELPMRNSIELGLCLFVLLSAIILIVTGIGLLIMQKWARWMSIIYSVFAFLIRLSYVIFHAAFVYPIIEPEIIAGSQIPPGQESGFVFGVRIGYFTVVAGPEVIFMIHALVLLIVMLLPNVSAAFAGRPVRRFERGDDIDDEREDDYGYRRISHRRDEWDD